MTNKYTAQGTIRFEFELTATTATLFFTPSIHYSVAHEGGKYGVFNRKDEEGPEAAIVRRYDIWEGIDGEIELHINTQKNLLKIGWLSIATCMCQIEVEVRGDDLHVTNIVVPAP